MYVDFRELRNDLSKRHAASSTEGIARSIINNQKNIQNVQTFIHSKFYICARNYAIYQRSVPLKSNNKLSLLSRVDCVVTSVTWVRVLLGSVGGLRGLRASKYFLRES